MASKRFGRLRRAIPTPFKDFLYRRYFFLRAQRDKWQKRQSVKRLQRDLEQRVPQERLLVIEARCKTEAAYSTGGAPLISVVVATYNRAAILVERTLPSVFAQTYQNFEIVIVGDGCTDDTEARLKQVDDPRVRFYNLPQRGIYPKTPRHHWMVAGTGPANRALAEARGLWIASLDDDDIYMPDHLELLLRHAQAHDLEVVYSQMSKQVNMSHWVVQGQPPFSLPDTITIPRMPQIAHSAVLVREYLRFFGYDINAWRYELPGDRRTWMRMMMAGVRFGFVEQVSVSSPLRPGITVAEIRAEDRK